MGFIPARAMKAIQDYIINLLYSATYEREQDTEFLHQKHPHLRGYYPRADGRVFGLALPLHLSGTWLGDELY